MYLYFMACMRNKGIRVTEPEKRLNWYARTLGFNKVIKKYDANPEPLKNGQNSDH